MICWKVSMVSPVADGDREPRLGERGILRARTRAGAFRGATLRRRRRGPCPTNAAPSIGVPQHRGSMSDSHSLPAWTWIVIVVFAAAAQSARNAAQRSLTARAGTLGATLV